MKLVYDENKLNQYHTTPPIRYFGYRIVNTVRSKIEIRLNKLILF